MVQTRILVVDDDAGVRLALQRLLGATDGVSVAVAADADDAERELARGAVDVLVLDFHLRGMRGDAFFHRACEMQPSLRDRTVFITGDVSPDANAAICATARPYLLKPFLASSLLQVVATLSATSPLRVVRSA